MLKFIRKYQMIILVVGGSLLMVVFLLEPVLTRLAPSPLKAKVAKLESGKVYTRGEIVRAQAAITLLGRANPRALQPLSVGGLGLNTESEQTAAMHWLMFSDMAKQAGLVGQINDGASWIEEIARSEAVIQATTEARQGQIPFTDTAILQRANEYQPQIIAAINRSANAAAAEMRGSMEDVYRVLAEARGMERLLRLAAGVPSFSEPNAIAATKAIHDAVAVNAVVMDSSVIADAIEDPSDDQLDEFFAEFSTQQASENEFGIGYMQPTRIKLGWIALNKATFSDAVEIDDIEVHKIWTRNRDTYPGDIAAEKSKIEDKYRSDQADEMMVEADRLIRAQVLSATSSLPKENGKVVLPEDWDQRGPKLDEIAQFVTERINQEFRVSIPSIEVNLVGDRWLAPVDITSLPGVGFSIYRVGSQQVPTYLLPQVFEPDAPTISLDIQPMLPIVEQAAVDQAGNRYYSMVLDVREAGPADGIDDAGRERVVDDYKSLKAFELLESRRDELIQLVANNDDLAPAVDAMMAMTSNPDAVRPSVQQQILVKRESIDAGRIMSNVNPRLNNDEFRTAVHEAASGLEPLVAPEVVKQNPIVVATSLPRTRSFALAQVLAPRPVTVEQYQSLGAASIRQTTGLELREAGFFENNPFTFEALSDRYGLEFLDKDDEEEAASEPSEETAG